MYKTERQFLYIMPQNMVEKLDKYLLKKKDNK